MMMMVVVEGGVVWHPGYQNQQDHRPSHDIGKIPRTGSVKEEVTRYLQLPLIVLKFSQQKTDSTWYFWFVKGDSLHFTPHSGWESSRHLVWVGLWIFLDFHRKQWRNERNRTVPWSRERPGRALKITEFASEVRNVRNSSVTFPSAACESSGVPAINPIVVNFYSLICQFMM